MAKHAGGRPSKYDSIDLKQVTMFCRLGATDEELAEFLGIAVSTLNKWKTEHPEFMEAIKKGKVISDFKVVNSLYKRAIGFKCKKQSVFKCKVVEYDENGRRVEHEELKTKEYIDQVPPDSTACFFWLKNRRKEDWRDKQDINVTGGVNIVYADKDDKDL